MRVSDDETAEARTRFLALAQHKLNSPLAVIAGWSATLQDWDRLDPDERILGLDAINRAALELQAQIRDVLDEARARVLERSIRPELLRMDELLEEVVDAYPLDDDTHPVDVEVADALRAIGDDVALRKVLHHVIDNAVTYSPDGGAIHVSARAEADRCVITVRDHGLGLPENVDVFDPFRRGNDAAAVARGTGLGLHVARCLMTGMDGDISAERVADGTLVELSLPAG